MGVALLWPHSVQEVDGSVLLVKEAGQCLRYWWKGGFMASQSVEENIQRAHKSFQLTRAFSHATRSVIETCQPTLLFRSKN